MAIKKKLTQASAIRSNDSKIAIKSDYFTGELDPDYCSAFGWSDGRKSPPCFPFKGNADPKHFHHVVMNFSGVYSRWPCERMMSGAAALIKAGRADEVLKALHRQLLLIDQAGYHGKYFGVKTTLGAGISLPTRSEPTEEEIANGILNHVTENEQYRWLYAALLRRFANVASCICTTPGLPSIPAVDYSLLGRACQDFAFDLNDLKAEQRISTDCSLLGLWFNASQNGRANSMTSGPRGRKRGQGKASPQPQTKIWPVSWGDQMPIKECAEHLAKLFRVSKRTVHHWLGSKIKYAAKQHCKIGMKYDKTRVLARLKSMELIESKRK